MAPLSPIQLDVLDALLTHHNVVVLKARQVFVTTLVVGFFMWLALMREEGYRTFSLADCGDTVSSINTMYRNFARRQPAALSVQVVAENATRVALANGSEMWQRMAGGKGTGRGRTFQGFHGTESGFWPRTSSAATGKRDVDRVAWVSAVSAMPTPETEPWVRIVSESTAAGPGGLFHSQVLTARRSDAWALVFRPWFDHHEYRRSVGPGFRPTPEEQALMARFGLDLEQVAWRRYKVVDEDYGEIRFGHEYPSTPEEAFIASSTAAWFDQHRLSVALDSLPPLDKVKSGLHIFHEYQPQYRYFIGADASGGVGQDDAAVVVIRDDLVVAARWNDDRAGAWDQAEMAGALGHRYGRCPILVEINKDGKEVYDYLVADGYSNLWEDDDGKPWRTTDNTNRRAYVIAREFVDAGLVEFSDPLLVTQLIGIVRRPTGKVEADAGHDDVADAFVLAIVCGRDTFRARRRSAERRKEDRMARFRSIMAPQ